MICLSLEHAVQTNILQPYCIYSDTQLQCTGRDLNPRPLKLKFDVLTKRAT